VSSSASAPENRATPLPRASATCVVTLTQEASYEWKMNLQFSSAPEEAAPCPPLPDPIMYHDKPLSCPQGSTGGPWPLCVFPPPVGLPAPSEAVLSSLIPSINATKSFTLI